MAKGLLKNYTFNTAAKTITLTDVTTVRLDKLALITDTTTNKILYNFADLTVATATVATNVITLSVLQGGEANGDKLRIDYDVESSDTAAFADTTQPVSATTLPLPTGASTSALQTTGNSSLSSVDTKTPALGQALAAASTPVVLTAAQITTLTPPAAITGFATETTLGTRLSESDFDTKTGSLTETAPATDTASSGLNGRLQRIAQRLTSLITALGSPFQAGGSIGNTSFGATQATAANLNATVVGTGTFAAQVTGSVTANAGTNLNTSALALDSTVAKDASITTTNTQIGIVTEAAPASDTASSGLNGRLQRIAQRLTSLIALFPTSLGQGTMATSMKVVLPSDQAAIPVTLTSTTVTGTVTVDTELPTAAALADAASATPTTPTVGSVPLLMNATTVDRQRTVRDTLDSTGTGIAAAGLVAQYDDVSPTAPTENQFSPVRMSKQRALYSVSRSANGEEFGASVTPSGDMQTSDSEVGAVLQEILLEIQARNESEGVDSSNTNRDRILNGNLLEVVGIANTRDRIKTKLLTLSATTAETTLIPGDQNVYNDVLAIVAINTSASTSTRIDIRDDTGGAVIIPLMSIGGSTPVGFSLGGVAIPQTTRGATWTAQCATSTTDVRLLVIYSIN